MRCRCLFDIASPAISNFSKSIPSFFSDDDFSYSVSERHLAWTWHLYSEQGNSETWSSSDILVVLTSGVSSSVSDRSTGTTFRFLFTWVLVWIPVTSPGSSSSLLILHVLTVFLESTSFTHTRSFLFGRAVGKDSFCNMCVRLCVTTKGRLLWDHFQICLQVPIPTMLQKVPCRERWFSSREPLTTRRQGGWCSHPDAQFGHLREHCSKNCLQPVRIQDVTTFDQQLWALLRGNRCALDQLLCHHPARERCMLSFAPCPWRRRAQRAHRVSCQPCMGRYFQLPWR